MTFDAGGDEGTEEVLPARRPLPLWIRAGAIAVVVLVGGYLLIHALGRSAGPHPVAAPSHQLSSVPTHPSTLAPISPISPIAPAWPTAGGACDDEVQVPIVSSVPPREPTGLSILLGGTVLRQVDFDSGRWSGYPQPPLHGGYVTGFAGSHALVTLCMTPGVRVFDVSSRARPRALAGPGETLVADGDQAWSFTFPGENSSTLARYPNGTRHRLPHGFEPATVTDGVAVGAVTDRHSYDVLLVDADTGRPSRDLGRGVVVAAAHGQVVWDRGCPVIRAGPCVVYVTSVYGGTTSAYRLPRTPGFGLGTISPDGRLLALTLLRTGPDPHHDAGYPLHPADIAVLDLATGRVEIVPGIELPAKESPGLTFAPNGRWLAIALDAGARTRVLAWRPGLGHPYETTPVPGYTLEPPPIAVLPLR